MKEKRKLVDALAVFFLYRPKLLNASRLVARIGWPQIGDHCRRGPVPSLWRRRGLDDRWRSDRSFHFRQ